MNEYIDAFTEVLKGDLPAREHCDKVQTVFNALTKAKILDELLEDDESKVIDHIKLLKELYKTLKEVNK